MSDDVDKTGSKVAASQAALDPVSDNRLPKGIYNNFVFEFFNAVMWQSFGSPVILFIRQAGASAFVVGSLSAIPLLLMPLTLASSRLVEQWGYRRTALTCWTFRWLFCSTLIFVALYDAPGFAPWRVPIVLMVIFLFHLMRNFGVSANIPWQTSIIPPARRGLYLSRATLFSNLASIGTFLLIGAMLGKNPTLAQFGAVFLLGAIGGMLSSFFMSRIQPPPKIARRPKPEMGKPGMSFWKGVKRCFAQPGFLSFVLVQTFYGLAFIAIPSLSLIYLRERVSISADVILYFSTAGVAGATVAALFWGRWIDRRGIYSLQLLAFIGLCFNSILWFCIGLFGANELNIALAALVTLLSAVWISALNMTQTHSIMAMAPEDDRVLFQNIATFMTYCSQALAPMLWGILIDLLDHSNFNFRLGGVEVGAFRLFFLASLFIGLGGALFLLKLNRRQIAAEEEAE